MKGFLVDMKHWFYFYFSSMQLSSLTELVATLDLGYNAARLEEQPVPFLNGCLRCLLSVPRHLSL